MKILIFWDIYGRLWRKGFMAEYPKLCEKYSPDFTVVNIENITSGRWPVSQHAELIEWFWVDVMTSGDHIYDNVPNILEYLGKNDSKLIRPANFYSSELIKPAGEWYKIVEKNGKRLLVLELLGESFMNHKVENPFLKIESLLKEIPKSSYDVAILEFHRETTAELYGMSNFLDGQIGLVYGTHTHIQTNDAHILPGGTWMLTDVGMNWPFNSVIWADFNSVKKRFLSGVSRWKIEQKLTGPYLTNALYAEMDEETGLCTHVENISYSADL